MKLEQFLIREVFDADDFGAVIRIIERHFGVNFPDSAFNEKHHTVYRDPNHLRQINIVCMSKRYSWSDYEGFTLGHSSRVHPDYVHARIFTSQAKAPP